jgi:phage gpG-like protein
MKVEIQGGDDLMRRLAALQKRITAGLREAINRATFDLVGYVKERKLSDQVLRVRTGRLRRSITGKVTEENGQPVGIVGTNVSYARVHEFGFRGRVKVRAHARKVKGKKVPVRAHSRDVDIPKRAFLVPSLNERMPAYKNWMTQAVQEATRAPGA